MIPRCTGFLEGKLTGNRHFKRVVGYARTSDYLAGGATAAAGPALMLLWERVSPSHVGKGGFPPIMRLAGVLGLGAGFLVFYQRSIRTFMKPFLILMDFWWRAWIS